ncbi:M56 family metallopeptidase [Mucilaginibacter sp.]|jgi:beta-lactamase regulating signal transducer with metallopeptidase domain|uniref:M56 family metallopeptidase n=1 Tax=Mucilaginibacter sp. TaxID=1882438 RepID=UPI002CC6060B|nr:M56 family metallopeptidase [Mucilaginibacter sp.]HTI60714.1 M56 family metallopeptidase [Mucilaginibacter sp.]
MTLTLIDTSIPDQLIGALCNTLIHSLWQGVLLAAMAGLIVIWTRKASSALRYNLLIATLSLFAVAIAVTFTWQYKKAENAGAATVIGSGVAPQIQLAAPVVYAGLPAAKSAQDISLADRFNNYLNTHHDTIISIWFLIVCMRCLQLSFGLYGTYRLKRVNVATVKDDWMQRVMQLAAALGISQSITLLESGLAKVPMVIGNLKPVILVPIGLLAALSAEEVEAILIHELAHIKRRDYLVNVLQSLVEIVFFFNPAVLWVSELIKTERENCCDDLALAQNNNKVNYIRALVSCEEYQTSLPAYAMAFPGGRSTLLDRVKRLASNRNHSLNTFEKTMLAVCLVVLGLGVSAFTAREHIEKALKSVAAVIHHEPVASKDKVAKTDTTKKKLAAQANDANVLRKQLQLGHPDTLNLNRSDALNLVNHNLDSLLKLNGNSLHLQENGGNAALILSQLGKQDTLRLAELLKNNAHAQLLVLAKPDTNLLKNLRALNPQSYDQMHAIGRELYREHLITDTNHLSISLNEHELIVNSVKMPQQVYERINTKFGRKSRSGSNGSNYASAYSSSSTGYGVNYSTDSGSYGDKSKNYQRENEERQKYWAGQQKKIIADLLRDGLISDAKNMSFSINDKEFIVDGKRQSDEVYNTYKKKYMPGKTADGWSWSYSHHE